jgi:hypothetical protein
MLARAVRLPTANRGIPISVIVAPCLVGIAIWSGIKLKRLTVSADVVAARNAAKSGLLIIGIGLTAVAFIAYEALYPLLTVSDGR